MINKTLFRQMTGTLLAAAVFITGCNTASPAVSQTETYLSEALASGTAVSEETLKTDETGREEKKYKFNPHLHSEYIGSIIPDEYYSALYNLIDALREGRDSFACPSEEAYLWATDAVTLNNLFPAACVKVSGKSDDGTTPYENGVGRVYMNMSAEEFIERENAFEAEIEEILNTRLEYDDNDFEKCLKLYDYMESTFTYADADTESTSDGANYKAFMLKEGVCDHIAGIYAYILMQAGVEAMNIGVFEPDMCHAWTYIVIGGTGYHTDATWALKKERGEDTLCLDYFMMSDERREQTGCLLNDITAPLLPLFWAKYHDAVDFKAEDKQYDVLASHTFKELDEENKILYFSDADGNVSRLNYGL